MTDLRTDRAAESGLIIFKLIEGQLAHRNTHLEVLMDDNLFPAYSTAKAKTAHVTYNETGDAMVRELDLSRITLRLVEKVDHDGDNGEDHVEAKVVGQTYDTLRRCLHTPTVISLKGKDGGESRITVSMRYLPVKMQLDPSESFNNSGTLRVDVLDAADLPAADRNGKSDPYVKFTHNGKEVYKTKTQKKTLHPAWNEFFEIPVRSRTGAQFVANVYDWDFGDKADFLGAAAVPLDKLEPFQPQEVALGLDGKSGTLRLKMLFKPDYVTRSRQGSSTFSGTFATPGKVIGAPVKGVGKGAMFIGGGVTKGAGFLGRGFKRRTVSGNEVPQIDEPNGGMASMQESPLETGSPTAGLNGHAPQASVDGLGNKELPATPHQRVRSFGGAAAGGTPQSSGAVSEPGTASIAVMSASGFEGDPKLEVHVLHDTPKGLKKILETPHHKAQGGAVTFDGESKKVPCNADSQFRLQVNNHKTFGSDLLGEAAFFVNDQAAGGQQEVRVGAGTVVLRTSFVQADVGSIMGSTLGSGLGDSPASKKGGLGRFVSSRGRSVTPSG